MPLAGQRMLLAAYWLMLMIAASTSPTHAQAEAPVAEGGTGTVPAEERTGELTLSVKDNGMKLGDAIVRIGIDNSISIKRDSFLVAIKDVFRKEALRALADALPPKPFISIPEIEKAGLVISYNSNDLELNIEPKVEQRPRGEIDGTIQKNVMPEGVVKPAALSGFVNTRFGFAYERTEGQSGSYQYPAIMFEGAGRWSDIVLEGDGFLEADGTFSRQSTRLVYDRPDDAIRVTVGDLDLHPSGSFSVPPLMGVAIEKSYADLQPTRNVRPTSRRSFRLERPSEVQVLVNGTEARRLHLQPGEYDLNDLPLATGTNNIQLRIKDDFGREETVDFSILFNRTLLDPGISEWSFAGGVAANAGLGSPSYDTHARVLSGTYRRGITETITGGVSGQTSEKTSLLGVSALKQTTLGLLSLDSAGSATEEGEVGWSASALLDVETAPLWDTLNSAQLGVEFFSEGFASALNQVPSEGSRIRVSGGIGQRLPDDISASLSGYVQIAEEERDRGFGANISLTKPLSQEWSLSLSGNYNHRDSVSTAELGGVGLFARLSFRPDADSSVTAQYDYTSNKTSIAGGTNYQEADKRGSINVEWEHAPTARKDDAETISNANLYYADSRIEVNASQASSMERFTSGTLTRRTSVNAGMGFAFADDKAAFGRPVHGGFAIVDRHKSLQESDIRVDPFETSYKAGSDSLGPLLISDISAYARSSLSYEVDNLPPGYDIGTGVFEFFAPYKSGHNVMIGSDFSVTAVGTLQDSEGNPVPLKAGTVSTDAYPDKRVVVFTNGDGFFSVPGLKAGDWQLELSDDKATKYVLHIPEDVGAYVELGVLAPKG